MVNETRMRSDQPVELNDESLDDVSGAGIVIEERGPAGLTAASHGSVGIAPASQQLSNAASKLSATQFTAT